VGPAGNPRGVWRSGPVLVACAAILLVGTACPPSVPKGVPVSVRAQESVSIESIADPQVAEPRVELLLLTGGSRWDPPGQEGRAWITAHALDAGPGHAVHVGRDRAWLIVPCGSGQSPCQEPLERLLVPPGDAVAATRTRQSLLQARQRLTAPEPQVLLDDVLHGLLYPAHPYDHPVAGRLGVLDPDRRPPPGWESPSWSRLTTRARVVAPSEPQARAIADRIQPVLDRLPAHLPPDPAMKGPPPTPGPIVARVPLSGDTVHVRVGVVLPRRPTWPTGTLPDLRDLSRWADLSACLPAAVPDLTWDPPAEAPPGWPAEWSTPLHPALIWSTTLPPDQLQARLDELPAQLEQLPQAISTECASDPQVTAAWVQEAVEAGYVVVVGMPEGLEDPPELRVQGAEMLTLPAPDQDLFR